MKKDHTASSFAEFHMGRRLTLLRNLGFVGIIAVSFVFYFIYDYVLIPSFPQFKGAPLAAIFATVDLLLCYTLHRLIKHYRVSNYYQVFPDRLVHNNGRGGAREYNWRDFSEAYRDKMQLNAYCPITFIVKGERLKLNQYTEDIYDLALSILDHIAPYLELDEELRRQVAAMANPRTPNPKRKE